MNPHRRSLSRLCCALACLTFSTACSNTPKPALTTDETAVALPSYSAIAAQYNQRTDRLTRLWSRAVVQARYTDQKGRERRQQGEGHLQLVQPSNIALSIGKLGEVLFWLGANDERFWIFELGDERRVSVCRHENVGKQCAQSMSVPVHPLVLMELLGITPLPPSAQATITRDPGTGSLVVEFSKTDNPRRLFLDPQTLLPSRIELLTHEGELAVWSELGEYQRIAMKGSPGFNPQVATRISIDSADATASVLVFLSDPSDGKAIGRIPDAVFNFETLMRAHRPATTIVLDEHCPSPAIVATSHAEAQP
jgi:hypothetical protein